MSNGHGEKLSRLRATAIVALLHSRTRTEAAGKLGLHVSTLNRWCNDAEFKRDLEREQQKLLDAGRARLLDDITDRRAPGGELALA